MSELTTRKNWMQQLAQAVSSGMGLNLGPEGTNLRAPLDLATVAAANTASTPRDLLGLVDLAANTLSGDQNFSTLAKTTPVASGLGRFADTVSAAPRERLKLSAADEMALSAIPPTPVWWSKVAKGERAFHGTDTVFDRMKSHLQLMNEAIGNARPSDMEQVKSQLITDIGGALPLDQIIGSHFARDPAISDVFSTARSLSSPSLPGNIQAIELPPKAAIKTIPQPVEITEPTLAHFMALADRSLEDLGKVGGGGRGYVGPREAILRQPDAYAADKLIRQEGFTADKDLLEQVLRRKGLLTGSNRTKDIENLFQGEPIKLVNELGESKVSYSLDQILSSPQLQKLTPRERIRLTVAAVSGLESKGIDALQYINTIPEEIRGAEDATSFIVFRPDRLRTQDEVAAEAARLGFVGR